MFYLGTSGYHFRDWIGTAYPEDIKPSQMLNYYRSIWHFNTVELNFTYYRMPDYHTLAAISRKVPGDFHFTVKSPGSITHEYWKNLEFEKAIDDLTLFKNALAPLRSEGRLGPVLFQFPWGFRPTNDNLGYLKAIMDFCTESELIPAVEFRHSSWEIDEYGNMLIQQNAIPVIVDAPKIDNLFGYRSIAGRGAAYFRLHGRNVDWFTSNGSERYNYNYSDDELRFFALDVIEFLSKGLDVYVYFNNCHMGNAVHNALRFREIVGGA
ncbi:hypothetical protein AT15_00645 [Kosmotoga arenicorallina S304]|uniref:DUF72 domain-containing protein n=1 Tax=Kosmotoga arenicorallina S304 TaxID=1453497 RepID=A0A176K0M9_9BACT|nr:DUF72 domain-containing protein [Kosmotoga arenicorallina]OAA30054.1 hypothetical protein AT15_00645 [Kosmotoga arenicorallina S304]